MIICIMFVENFPRSLRSLSIYNNSFEWFLCFVHNLGKSYFFKVFQLCIFSSYFNLRRASTYAYNCIGIKDSEIYKLALSSLSAPMLIGNFLVDFLRPTQNNFFFSTTIIKRSWILFWDICHLFWDTEYLSKHYLGISEKLIQGYGIFGVIYYGAWNIGYSPKQASIYIVMPPIRNLIIINYILVQGARMTNKHFQYENDICVVLFRLVITSLYRGRQSWQLCASRLLVCLHFVASCFTPLSLGPGEGLWFFIMALPGDLFFVFLYICEFIPDVAVTIKTSCLYISVKVS